MTGNDSLTSNVTIPETHTITGTSREAGNVSVVGSGGSATGSYNSRTTSTVTYTTSRVEAFDAYFANYSLRFPLYSPEGVPYVTAKTKEITIKVVRRNGEHSGTFRLDRYK